MGFLDLEVWDDTSSRTAAGQMAADEVLLERAAGPVLRVYRWEAPSVTFGYAQRWREVSALAGGRPLIRRWTGGGAVFHGEDLTLALAVPASDALAQKRAGQIYREIHEAIWLALGGDAAGFRLATADDCRPGAACFVSPVPCDILQSGRKVCGGALRRGRRGVLYQGSLHQHVPITALAAALSSCCRTYDPGAGFEAAADHLARTRYETPEWNRLR